MKITPIDIAHKSFDKKLFGLDGEEVAEFLSEVANAMEAVIHERNALKEALREKELQLIEYKDRDQVLKNTVITASQMSEKIKQDAEREAKLIIGEAHQNADAIVRDARESLRRSYNEISELKRLRLQFESTLRALANSHLTLLEQGEKSMPSINIAAPQNTTTTNTTTSKTGLVTRSTIVSPLSSEML